MTALTLGLFALAAAAVASTLLTDWGGPGGGLVRLQERAALHRRLPWLVGPLAHLHARLDPSSAPPMARLLLDLEARLVLGGLPGGAVAGLPGAVVTGAALVLWRLRGLHRRVVRREAAALRQLPLILDLLALGVEAGIPIGSALDLAARRGPPGPLRDALGLLVGAVAAGRSRREALHTLVRALPLPAVASLAAAIEQTDRLGGRLAPALRAQAAQQRIDRWNRAERRALLAPVRLLLPLALCIFPATFVVLLLPLALRFAAEVAP